MLDLLSIMRNLKTKKHPATNSDLLLFMRNPEDHKKLKQMQIYL